MKIIHKDLRKGEIKIKAENLEDLWYISQIVDKGDHISGKTLRKIKAVMSSDERARGVEKKPVFLKINVEKVEFSKTTNNLRILGAIEEGPEDIPRGTHHTFNVEENTIITIKKDEWLKFRVDKLIEAAEEKLSKIFIVVFDREEAFFALMKKYGYELVGHIEGDVEKKQDKTKSKGGFYTEIIKQIQEYDKRYELDFIILASPAFWKEELLKELRDEKLRRKIIQATCSSVNKSAINEVLKRDEVKKALREDRIIKEMNIVERLFVEISKDKLAVYGLKDVENACMSGAVDVLLVTDSLIHKSREEGNYERVEQIMKMAEKNKGDVFIISSDHEGGKKLNGLGGIGAITRYKIGY